MIAGKEFLNREAAEEIFNRQAVYLSGGNVIPCYRVAEIFGEWVKDFISDKGMSVNAYIQDLVRKDQCGMFDTMQIAEKNREMISGISGNMHDGYDIIFKDGHSCHCRTKKDVRQCIIEYCCKNSD